MEPDEDDVSPHALGWRARWTTDYPDSDNPFHWFREPAEFQDWLRGYGDAGPAYDRWLYAMTPNEVCEDDDA